MRLLCAVAAVALVASSVGCQTLNVGRSACGPNGCHVTRSQMAPRPDIQRTACVQQTGCICDMLAGNSCGCGADCGCGDCCDTGCCGSCDCGPCGTYGGCGCGGGNCFVNGAVSAMLDCPCNSPGDRHYDFNPGPAVGQVAYPYYTVRGPRDFLARNPRSIGPTGAYGCR